jgi:hypothetical protein
MISAASEKIIFYCLLIFFSEPHISVNLMGNLHFHSR